MEKLLKKAYDEGIKYSGFGKSADYIPELAKEDSNKAGVVLINKFGEVFQEGEVEKKFSIQSIVKVILYLMVLENCDKEKIEKTIGVKPTSLPFNSILDLELGGGKPRNPFINSGAIASTALLYEKFGEKTFDKILDRTRELIGDESIDFSESIFTSERDTAYNNIAITNIMVARGVLSEELPREKVADTYFKACSILVNAKDLAKLSYIISNDGFDEGRKTQVFKKEYGRVLRTVMAMAGMYDYSGEFALNVGMPAKSGVGGGIIVSSNAGLGIATYCPGLDDFGNSLVGIKMLEIITEELKLKIY